jgi:hypothetical protein
MNRLIANATVACLLFSSLGIDALVAQTKPLLSKSIRKAIDTKGIEAAKKQFAESYQSNKDFYNIDMQGITELTSAYTRGGNIDAASAVMAIATPYIQDQIAAQIGSVSPGFAEKLAERREEEKEKKAMTREEKHSPQQNEIADYQGQPRSDLERFTGLYGDPEDTSANRKLWVTISCDGYLISGALWGDASPWWLKSAGDKLFTYEDSFSKVRMEFETDGNGKGIRMTHNINYIKTPLKRLGPLPGDWEPCVERPKK